jgi:hypothetical protein
MKHTVIATSLLSLGLLGAPLFAQSERAPAQPGTVNYVEGSVSVDGQPVSSNQIGSITLEPGKELATQNGKAEVLLTPGVFLRVDSNSAVKLVSPELLNTQVAVERGKAAVEVDQIHDQNNLQVIDAGVTTRLKKTGYYEFNAGTPAVQVFKGKADVQLGNKTQEVKGHHEMTLTTANGEPVTYEKPANFDTSKAADGLYNWSQLRSEYLAEANNEAAGYYEGAGYDPGWYWNPYGFGYTYIGAGPFYSPFGWGFYPFGWGGWGGGWYAPYYGHRGYYRMGDGHIRGGEIRGGQVHSAPRGNTFHGSAGGFHGGMGGGMGGGAHLGGGMHR